jgi:hypothetical protein
MHSFGLSCWFQIRELFEHDIPELAYADIYQMPFLKRKNFHIFTLIHIP